MTLRTTLGHALQQAPPQRHLSATDDGGRRTFLHYSCFGARFYSQLTFSFSDNTFLGFHEEVFLLTFAEPGPDRLLTHLRENVLDVIHSTDVNTNPIYDFRKIESIAEGYYRGELRLRSSLECWLTFEIWRSSLLPAAGDSL
jgi:hypothetical protein